MAKTKTLGLELTENDSLKFKDWRETINGNKAVDSKSNAQIIDDFAGNVNTKLSFTRKTTEITLTIHAGDWVDSTADITADINVVGVSADSLIFVSPAPDSYLPYTNARVRATEQGNGCLTFACEEVPTVDIVVNLVVMEALT